MTTTPFPTTGPDLKRLPDGSPRPVDPATGQPLMTAAEANWHAHVSGMAAAKTAEHAGDPAATTALLDGAVMIGDPFPLVGDLPLLPLTIGTFETLQLAGSKYTAENPQGTPLKLSLMDLARTALIFAKPEWCYRCLRDPARTGEFEEAAAQLSFFMDRPTLVRVNEWIEREMREFFGEDATSKKPDSPAGPVAMSPVSPAIAPDLSAGGCPP